MHGNKWKINIVSEGKENNERKGGRKTKNDEREKEEKDAVMSRKYER